jgi:hypothetical protein
VTQGLLNNPEKHPIKSRRSRLKQLLAEAVELDKLIVTKRRMSGYELDLPPGDIFLLQDDGHGRLHLVRRNRPSE